MQMHLCHPVAKKAKTPEKRECIVCRADINNQDERIHYSIYGKNNAIVGKMDVHRNKCFYMGAAILEEQVNDAEYVDSINVTNTIGGKAMYYTLEGHGDNIYDFRTYEYSRDFGKNLMLTGTIKTLDSCLVNDGMVFAKIKEYEGRDVYKIPTLMSRNDPEIPEGTFSTPEYKKRHSDALAKHTRSMCVRGKNRIEASRILAQCVREIMIAI